MAIFVPPGLALIIIIFSLSLIHSARMASSRRHTSSVFFVQSTWPSSYSVRALPYSSAHLISVSISSEERAGHHLKLYQYCSGDIHDIVQRHMRVCHSTSLDNTSHPPLPSMTERRTHAHLMTLLTTPMSNLTTPAMATTTIRMTTTPTPIHVTGTENVQMPS